MGPAEDRASMCGARRGWWHSCGLSSATVHLLPRYLGSCLSAGGAADRVGCLISSAFCCLGETANCIANWEGILRVTGAWIAAWSGAGCGFASGFPCAGIGLAAATGFVSGAAAGRRGVGVG